jgi:protein ImuB
MSSIHSDGLWLCLYFSQLPVEIFTRDIRTSERPVEKPVEKPVESHAEKPVVVHQRQRISYINSTAKQLGVRVGSSMETAYTLSNQVVGCERNEDKELFTLTHLSQWAYRFTPNVSIKPPHCLLLDIKSSLNLFAGIDNIRSLLLQGLSRLGYSATIGVHSTPLAAFSCAQANLKDNAPAASMPVQTLDVDNKIIESLHQMGARSVDDVLLLPRSGLARRFGVYFSDYLQRLTGEKPDPQKFVGEKPAFASEISFLSDVTNLESLVFPVRRLVQELCDFLSARQLKINTFTFRLDHRNHDPKSFSIYLAEPDNDSQMFLLLTQLQLEKIQDVKEVDAIKLSARQFFSGSSLSGDLFRGTQFQKKDGRSGALSDRENGSRLLNIINTRLGQNTCFGLSLANDHRPEKAWKPVSISRNDHGNGHSLRKGYWYPEGTDIRNTRPTFLIAKPRPLPHFPGPLKLLQGPERIDFGWWDENSEWKARDYYIARHTGGGLYWIFKETQSQLWYLHGVFS